MLNAIQVLFPFLLLASIAAALASVRASRRMSPPDRAEQRTAGLIGLVLAGPLLTLGGFSVADERVFPVVRRLVWPVVQSATGWVSAEEIGNDVYEAEHVIAVWLMMAVLASLAGLGHGWRRSVRPLDGYFLFNPVSTGLGYVLHSWAVAPLSEHDPEYVHWGAAVWSMHLLLACPLYAWLFTAVARRIADHPSRNSERRLAKDGAG